jgi:peptidoglycan/LPS O-acetylase OafA/YrhL
MPGGINAHIRWSASAGLMSRATGLFRSDLAHDRMRRDRSDGIDVLRAVFALWVVLTHVTLWSPLAQGPQAVPQWLAGAGRLLIAVFQPNFELHPAVLGFIVLSGYCIHRAGLRTADASALRGYAIRRFFRIGPVYYLAIVAGLVGIAVAGWRSPSLAAALSGTTQIEPGCLVAKAFVLSAFVPAVYQCGFLGNAPIATVLVEIVLYIVYAAAFAGLVWRGRERVIWLGCAILLLFSLLLLASGPSFYGWWQNGSLFGFLPYWWLGVAFVNPAFARASTRRLWLILLAWAALTALMLLWPPAALALAELRKLCFALGIGVLIVAVDNVGLRGFGALALVGRSGYGLYAVHAPLTYTLVIYGIRWWLVLIANVAAGLLLHYAVERPLVDLGRNLRLRLASRSAAIRLPAAE